MITVVTILVSVFFQLAFAIYFKWQHMDELDGTLTHNKNDDKWHTWGWVMRINFFVAVGSVKLLESTWGDILIAGVASAAFYDVFINLFALKQKIFYPGSSSDYDKKYGKYKWFAYLFFLIVAIIYRVYEDN